MNKKLLITIMASMLITGCTVNGLVTPTTEIDREELKMAGIPLIFAFNGSAVRLDDNWVVTAKHNKGFIFAEEIYEHPNCDIMIFKSPTYENIELIKTNSPKKDEKITTKGYASFLMLPSKGEGHYIEPLMQNNCRLGMTDAPAVSGMSGGGVYNESNELLGINQSLLKHIVLDEGSIPLREEGRRRTIFVPICEKTVEPWIEEITKLDLCEKEI